MSWVDRINAALVQRLHRNRPTVKIAVGATGLTIAGRLLPFAELTAVRAGRRDVFAGDESYLLLAFAPDEVVEITEADAIWNDAITALDASGRTREASREWLIELLATAPGAEPITVALR